MLLTRKQAQERAEQDRKLLARSEAIIREMQALATEMDWIRRQLDKSPAPAASPNLHLIRH